MSTSKLKNIKTWAEEDRPREKLMMKGIQSLSNAELLAILIRTGTKNSTAVDLSKDILNQVKNNLHALGDLNLHQLQEFKGIGETKAITILAALELGRRRKQAEFEERTKIQTSQDVFNFMQPVLENLTYEEFWILYLNRANRLIDKIKLSHGGIAGTVIDVKLIYKFALEKIASALVLCHNHPSGNTKPSDSDINITKKISDAGKFFDIKVLDHLIICDHEYFSFADEKMVE